jgi:hypothetical protein
MSDSKDGHGFERREGTNVCLQCGEVKDDHVDRLREALPGWRIKRFSERGKVLHSARRKDVLRGRAIVVEDPEDLVSACLRLERRAGVA